MDLRWFRDLANLARTGHFSRAAELGNISQPAFSRRIKAVEGWVGVPLVDRSRHPVRLTNAGKRILEAGEQALDRLELERREVVEAASSPDTYVVTFGAQHSIGWRFYPAWLQAFEIAFGPVLSRLRADNLPDALADLRNHDLDFVIAYSSANAPSVGDDSRIESVVIGHDTLIPVCRMRPDGRPLFALDQTATEPAPFLHFGADAPISRHIEPLLARRGLLDRLRVVYENSMAGALRIRARDGAGIAWLPRSIVAPDIAAGLVTQTGTDGLEISLEVRLHRVRSHSNRLTRAIWAFLAVRENVPLLGNGG